VVGVKNVEALFFCAGTPPSPDVVNITINVIDVNDPPAYEKALYDVFRVEEEDPGMELLTPKVIDPDSDVYHIRLVSNAEPFSFFSISCSHYLFIYFYLGCVIIFLIDFLETTANIYLWHFYTDSLTSEKTDFITQYY